MYRLLQHRTRLQGSLRLEVERAMSSPWCWPIDGEMRTRLEAWEINRPTGARAGQSLLVSVHPGHRVTLWVLQPRLETGMTAVPFCAGAVRALAEAQQLAARHLPFLHRLPTFPVPEGWSARLLYKMGLGRDEVLDDTSFGLAMLLGAASFLLGRPLDPTLCALAAFRDGERLHGVQELESKLGLVASTALGVSRILVHRDQVPEAQRAVDALHRPLEIIGVERMAEALRLAFPNIEQIMGDRWDNLDHARLAAEELFHTTLFGSNVLLDWSGVAAAAESLSVRLQEKDPSMVSWPRIAFAARIARRHCGSAEPLAWPEGEWFHSLPRPIRLRVLAHVVQAATDSGAHEATTVLCKVDDYLPEQGEEHAEDLLLLGAQGRLLAATREYSAASETLRRAVAGWFSLWRPLESSYALGEYLRVLGILGDASSLREALTCWAEPFSHQARADQVALGFVRVAAARALVQTGQALEGLDSLNNRPELDWAYTPSHLQQTRLRWYARALDTCGRHTEAQRARLQLEASADNHARPPDNVLLARLDQALDAGADVAAHLELLRTSTLAAPLLRALPSHMSLLETARVLIEEYRY